MAMAGHSAGVEDTRGIVGGFNVKVTVSRVPERGGFLNRNTVRNQFSSFESLKTRASLFAVSEDWFDRVSERRSNKALRALVTL